MVRSVSFTGESERAPLLGLTRKFSSVLFTTRMRSTVGLKSIP